MPILTSELGVPWRTPTYSCLRAVDTSRFAIRVLSASNCAKDRRHRAQGGVWKADAMFAIRAPAITRRGSCQSTSVRPFRPRPKDRNGRLRD
jgi:hypothetical protein